MRNHSLSTTITGIVLATLTLCQVPVQAQNNKANYKLANKYSSSFLRPFTYSTSVSPQWIGKSNRFHYSYRTSAGTKYWLVDADRRTKEPLFDHAKAAGAITQATEKAVEATTLKISGVKFDKGGSKFKFSAGGFQFEYDRVGHTVKKIGKAPPRTGGSRTRGGRRGRGNTRNLNREEIQRVIQQRNRETERGRRGGGGERGRRDGGTSERGSSRTPSEAGRTYSPDKSTFVFAKDHNLYIVVGKKVPVKITKKEAKPASKDAKGKAVKNASAKSDVDKKTDGDAKTDGVKKTNGDAKTNGVKKTNGDAKTDGEKKTNGGEKTDGDSKTENGSEKKPAKPSKPKFEWKYDQKTAVQLSKDGVEDFSFGGAASRSGTNTTRRTRTTRTTRTTRGRRSRFGRGARGSRVSWAPDSSAFYTTRRDSRGLKDLFLINSIAQPRPSLQTYKYAMPGEEQVRTTELHYFHKDAKKLVKLAPKWKDESYQNMSWDEPSHQLRYMRRDRLLRNVEFCTLDPKTGKVTVLFTEGAKDGYLKLQSMRTLKDRKEMIWWSERTGWGHYYLYGIDGKLKNAITSGNFRASSIVSVDEKEGVLYFKANGREKGENIYYEHLYRIRLDGTGLTLLDPGAATHRSSLSPSKRFVVDNWTRVDQVPGSALRDAEGNLVMKLEETDLSRLYAVGWKMPETFSVKAADGVTDLYGNMWKPFDFDSNKKYPIIAHVYPGPQQEGVTHSFSASNSRQQLAQIGFIVIQVGHRGGTPKRSRAYANYGYYNLRDYGLADKKAAIEQLAMRHSFIDVEKVGIYGHSGGGFMTGAALLQKPYNDFFKVGVSSSGNHDNNIYNSSWSERYHGLKEVVAKDEKKTGEEKKDTEQKVTEKKDTEKTDTEKKVTDEKVTKKEDSKKTDTKKKEETKAKKGTRERSRRRRSTWRERLAAREKKAAADKEKKKDKKKFEIHIPTNAELAANLKGHLLLVHGEIDNNVHPANTMRLVDALIKANKRFDMLIIPGARHGFGKASEYFSHRMREFFAEHLIGDRQEGADIKEKSK